MMDTFLGNKEDGSKLLLTPTQRAQHMLTLGHCQTGKTELMRHVATQDIAAGRSVVAFDPASDPQVFSSIVEAAEKAGRLEDLALLAPSMPNYSITIDPLSKQLFSSEKAGGNLLSLWGRSWDDGASPFVAKMFRTAVASAWAFNTKPDGGLQHILNVMERMQTPEAMRETLASWFAQSAGVFKPGRGNRPLNRLMNGREIILVVLPDAFGQVETSRVFLSMLIACLNNMKQNGVGSREPVAIHIDEAPLFTSLTSLGDLLTRQDMDQVWVSAYCQDLSHVFSELKELYAEELLSNIATKLFFRSTAQATASLARPLFGHDLSDHELKEKLAQQVPGTFLLQDGSQWQSAAPIQTEATIGLPFAVVDQDKKTRSLGELAWLWKPVVEVPSPA